MVGLGPGDPQHLSIRALDALEEADIIIAYKSYIKLIEKIINKKEIISSGMKKEKERAIIAIEKAKEGKTIAVVSSGDSGIYGMAGLILELAPEQMEVEIVPGITAASAAASLLGAPLINDFVVISLSDLLTPWETIAKRLHAAGQGDFVSVLYNPRSQGRQKQLEWAQEIFMQYRDPSTYVGIVKNAHRGKSTQKITSLGKLLEEDVDMLTILIIANSDTRIINGKMITARGYE